MSFITEVEGHYQISPKVPESEWRYTANTLHPTQKPVGALMPLVMTFSQVGDVVLDPFAGSGSSAVAAEMLGRHSIAIELSEEYARLARERLQTGMYRTM
jgi:adenine-specific DNA-methyltransferase